MTLGARPSSSTTESFDVSPSWAGAEVSPISLSSGRLTFFTPANANQLALTCTPVVGVNEIATSRNGSTGSLHARVATTAIATHHADFSDRNIGEADFVGGFVERDRTGSGAIDALTIGTATIL